MMVLDDDDSQHLSGAIYIFQKHSKAQGFRHRLNSWFVKVLQQICCFSPHRFKHTQIRANAESAAFYVADDIEMEKTNKKLFSLLTTQMNLFNYEFWLNGEFSLKITSEIVREFPLL